MKILIILLVGIFAFIPVLIIGGLGFKRRFENDVYGRIYVWDKPWVLVTQDDYVKRAYEKLQRRFVIFAGVAFAIYLLVVAFVP
ncbi:MAG: hypothetical protein AB8B88_01075 [Devosiaceae bacterium]